MLRTLAFAIVAAAGLAAGIWIAPDLKAPIPRLLANAEKAAREHPKDAYPIYLRARLHSLAFAKLNAESTVYSKYSDQKPFSFPAHETVQVDREKTAKPLSTNELAHLRKSIVLYDRAMKMDPNKSIYHLGRAWMLQVGAPYASQLKSILPVKASPLTSKAMLDSALAGYFQILKRFLSEDRKTEGVMMGVPDAIVSQEAAERIIDILSARKQTPSEQATVVRLKGIVKEFESKPKAVTPIVFSLQRSDALARLIDLGSKVRFDMSGDGLVESGSWFTSEAGILVWDPEATGKITSGRQLFGAGTFWMMFPDGYQAMASLDDDRNGWLEGRELAGIAVWRDANSNGISDRGEVASLSAWGVQALRVRPDMEVCGMPAASQGVRWSDGSQSPSWDWVSERRR